MRKLKEIILALLVFTALGALAMGVYRTQRDKPHKELAKRIAELSPRGGPPREIEDLKKAIALYEAQIELNVKEGAQTGTYWKILAIRLADRDMHRDALAAFEKALYYNTSDPTIYYLIGVSAGTTAKSIVGFSTNAQNEKEHFYTLSENSYKRALELEPQYQKSMYGLGVLYTFELNRPAEAIPYLEDYLRILPNDIQAMFVLARAYYMTGNKEQAVELYDKIIARTKDPKVKAEAQNNKNLVWEQM